MPKHLRSEVAFVGTWIRDDRRDQFIRALVGAGIDVSVWGNGWEKSPLFRELRPNIRGRALAGDDYRHVIRGAKVSLGLLSSGNRDLHTRRSVEIPAIGGLLCAERTPEHLAMYREDEEAVFWSEPAECAEKCRELLRDDAKRERIRIAGARRVRELGLGNESVCKSILDALFDPGQPEVLEMQLPLHGG